MEIIILGSVVALGYFFSKKEEKEVYPNLIKQISDKSNIYDSNRVNEVNSILLERATNNYISAERPYETGILPANFNGFGVGNESILQSDVSDDFEKIRIDDKINRNKSIFEKEKINVDINNPLQLSIEGKDRNDFYEFGQNTESPSVNYLTGEPYDKEHNNMVPFFGSIMKQNTVENMNNVGLLDRFTGLKDVYKKKEELINVGDIKPQNIYGNSVFSSIVDKDRFVASSFRQNEKPFLEKRVFAVKSGAFENNIRPEFKTIDELSVNTKQSYNQRIVEGQLGSMRGVQAEVPKNKNETFYKSNAERGFVKSDVNNSVTRNTDYDILYKKSTIRDDLFTDYSGNPHKSSIDTRQQFILEGQCKENCDNNTKAIVTEPYRISLEQDSIRHLKINQGLANRDDYGAKNINIPLTDRETTENYRVISGQQKTKMYQQDTIKTTLKELLHNNGMNTSNIKSDFNQGVSKAHELGISNNEMKTTLKEDSNIINNKYLGIADKKDGLGYLTTKISVPTTLKEIMTEQAAYLSSGNPVFTKDHTVRKTYEDVIFRDNKQISIQNDRVNGPEKFNLQKGKESSFPNGIRENKMMDLLDRENTRLNLNGFYSETITSKRQIGESTKDKITNSTNNSPANRFLARPENVLATDILI
jgi:hypothetical protein